MQGHHSKDVVRNIVSASQLETELQLAQAQHGVAVLDVYNAEWGHCKALAETFKRLYTDAGDVIYLRFYSVECNAVLDSLDHPEEKRPHTAQRGMEYHVDTTPAAWTPLLQRRRRHAKPYFLLYKEGRLRGSIEGIDTPRICKQVRDLCKPEATAAHFLTNPSALQFWETNFAAEESEVGLDALVRALNARRQADGAEDLTAEDVQTLSAACNCTDGVVTAAGLQAWVGDTDTLQTALEQLIQVDTQSTEKESEAAANLSKVQEQGNASAAQSTTEEEMLKANEESPHSADVAELEEGAVHNEDVAELEEGAIHKEDIAELEEGAIHKEDVAELEEDAAHDEEIAELEEGAVHNEDVAELEDDAVHNEDVAELEDDAAHNEDVAELEDDAVHNEDVAELEDDAVHKEDIAEPMSTMAETTHSSHRIGSAAMSEATAHPWANTSDAELRVWDAVARLPLHYPYCASPMLRRFVAEEDEAAILAQLPTSTALLPTLRDFLCDSGYDATEVNMMCLAADQKVGSESRSYGKLSLILISCNAEESAELLRTPAPYMDELCHGNLVKEHPVLAFTVLTLGASPAEADECFFYAPPSPLVAAAKETLQVGDTALLSALTPLIVDEPPKDGFVVKIVGLPKVVELVTSDSGEGVVLLSHWYSKLEVIERSDSALLLQFVSYVAEAAFNSFAEEYTARLVMDEDKLDRKLPQTDSQSLMRSEAQSGGGDG